MAVSRMRSEKYAIKRLFMAESPKFPHPIGNHGRGARWWCQILNWKWKYGRFAYAQYKIRYITIIYGGMSEILVSYRVEEHDGDVRFQIGSRNMAVARMRSEKYAIKRSFMAKSPKFPHIIGNQGRGTRWWRWRQILNRKWKCGRFAHAQYKIRYITQIYGGMSEILASYRKSGSRNMIVMSDFRPEVEMWPFRACAVKKIRYKTLIYGGIAEIPPSYRK